MGSMEKRTIPSWLLAGVGEGFVEEGNRAPEAEATPSRNWGGPLTL